MGKFYDNQYFKDRDFLATHLAEAVVILLKSHKLRKILDVGCGTGRLVKYLNDVGFVAKGVDLSPIAVKKAKALVKKKNTIFKTSATKLPFKNKSFDLVIAISVIEHISNLAVEKFLKETHRILKPKGFIFLITPNLSTPIRLVQGKNWFAYKDPTHINFYTPLGIARQLKENNFQRIKFWAKTKYNQSFDYEFPTVYAKLPRFLKMFFIYLFFSTPIALIRNAVWIIAQKND
ncbi:methyltransferase domain-containing protein [Candidatus Daviesbacteria bacterium]|nr:methyltransferase domain-containing protein [Candidatus Daviesbacteria bacterium]